MADSTPNLDAMLEQQRRKLLVARMLPNTGPLTPEQRDEVLDTLAHYMQLHDITQKFVARQTAIANSTLNPIMRRTCKLSPDTIDAHLRELNDWMEVDARQRVNRRERKFVETGVARQIMACARKATEMPTMAVAHGPSGIGKTMVAHALHAKFPGAIYLCVSKGDASFTQVRLALATRLKVVGKRRKAERAGLSLNERIFDALRGTNRLILIDEAHRLEDGALEFLRDVFDHTHCPMLFMATVDLVERIRRDNDEDHGQIYRRFGYVRALAGELDQSGGARKALFTIAEIRALFESDTVKLHPDAQAYLHSRANMLGHGSLGLCDNLMKVAIEAERALRGVGPDERITITAALLHRIDRDHKHDHRLRADMDVALAATA